MCEYKQIKHILIFLLKIYNHAFAKNLTVLDIN